jgi:hypothetical protein
MSTWLLDRFADARAIAKILRPANNVINPLTLG